MIPNVGGSSPLIHPFTKTSRIPAESQRSVIPTTKFVRRFPEVHPVQQPDRFGAGRWGVPKGARPSAGDIDQLGTPTIAIDGHDADLAIGGALGFAMRGLSKMPVTVVTSRP